MTTEDKQALEQVVERYRPTIGEKVSVPEAKARAVVFEIPQRSWVENLRPAELQSLNAELINFLGQEIRDQEIRNEAEKLLAEISEILEGKEQEDFSEFYNRVNRMAESARVIDSINETRTLDAKEQAQVVRRLRERDWGKLLGENTEGIPNLAEGDQVINVLSPTDEKLQVKFLNDLIGMSANDNLIEKRRDFTVEYFKDGLKKFGISEEDAKKMNLEQNYKMGFFKISKDQLAPEKVNDLMNEVCERVNQAMKEKLRPVIKQKIEEWGNKPDSNEKSKKLKALKILIENYLGENGKGYKINFGISAVEGEGYENTVSAVSQAMEAARTASILGEAYGEKFSDKRLEKVFGEIAAIRQKLINEKVEDKNGQIFELFPDGGGLNFKVLRDVRKGKFEATDTDQEKLDNLKKYVKCINVIDAVKPFVHEEIQSHGKEAVGRRFGGFEETKSAEAEIIATFEKGGPGESANDEDKEAWVKAVKEVKEMLSRDAKDRRFTSREKFHKEASQIKNCAYVFFDKIDVGPNQLANAEHAILDAMAIKDKSKRSKAIEKIKMTAGDETTEEMRMFREHTVQAYKEVFGKEEADFILGDISGGDEINLALDLDRFPKEEVDLFIQKVQSKENVRAVNLLVNSNERNSDSEAGSDNRLKEHCMAFKKGEDGGDLAKAVLEKVEELAFALRLSESDLKKKMKELRLGSMVVVNNGEDFKIRLDGVSKLFSKDEAFAFIGAILKGGKEKS